MKSISHYLLEAENRFGDTNQYSTRKLEEFIADARKVHGDNFSFEKLIYLNAHTKGIFICPEHGQFEQKPENFLTTKYPCYSCYLNTIDRDSLFSDFVKKAIE